MKSVLNFKNGRGFSLLEVLVVLTTVSILIVLVGSIPNSLGLISKSRNLNLVKEVAIKKMEELREMPYSNLTDGEIYDSRLKLLTNAVGQVTVEDCNISICTQQEAVKEVIVKIDWKESGQDKTYSLKTLITEGGI